MSISRGTPEQLARMNSLVGREDALTWDILQNWKFQKDFDNDYSVYFKVRFPKTMTDGVVDEWNKPVMRCAWYIIKGRDLIVSTRPLCEPFEWIKVFSIDSLATGTEVIIEKTPAPWWMCQSDRCRVIGEQFFFSDLKGPTS